MLDLINIRKELHKIPEIAFEEFKTQEFILNILKKYKNIKIHTFDFTGILVEFTVNDTSYKMFRSDMDALPIKEETNCDFSSTHSGFMHACGHDLHMTILLGFIEYVTSSNCNQNILFLFQPAEEGKGGAKKIIETGMLDEFNISEVYALHVTGKFPLGTIATAPGIFFANTMEINVEIEGKSSHVAFPENGIDAFKVGVKFVSEVDNIINSFKNNGNNVLCSFGKIEAGVIRNATPASCRLEGTLRALDDNIFKELSNKIKEIGGKIELETGAILIISLSNFYKSVKNDTTLVKNLKKKIGLSGLSLMQSQPEMTAEDFGFFTDLYPGLLVWLGAKGDTNYDLHSSKFLPSDKAIFWGIELFKLFLN